MGGATINIRGGGNSKLGYGHCAINIVKEMTREGLAPSFFPIGNHIDLSNPEDKPYIQEAINNQDEFAYEGSSLSIWHEFAMAEHVGRGKKCGLPFFEMNRLDKRRVHHLNYLDLIFSPSKWAEEVMKKEGVTSKIIVVPMGVDREIFCEQEQQGANEESPTTFLNIGKMEKRKGHDILIEAFNKAFLPSDNVKLIMHWYSPFVSPAQRDEWVSMYRNSPLGDKIDMSEQYCGGGTDRELANLINLSDCCVFPTRAEGFGLPILQALSCGKPVITTNYSAHTEFCNSTNSMMVEFDELEDAHDDIWFHGQGEWGRWGDNQMENLVFYMRHIHALKQMGDPLINKRGVETAKQFSWGKTVEGIIGGIRDAK